MTEESLKRERRRRGYWLRLSRLRANLNQNEVARRLGLSERSGTTVLAWEQGRRDPKSTTLRALAAIYGVRADLLIDPPETDEERLEAWLTEAVHAAEELEREDWEAEQARGPASGGGPGDALGRRTA